MNTHLIKDLDKLKSKILGLANLVENNVRKSVTALRELSIPLANEVIAADKQVDEIEVGIEDECLKILALHQPVASDLRFVITVLKINNELEHISDTATNIAKRVQYILEEKRVDIPFDIDTMTSRTVFMLKTCLDAFLTGDEMLSIGVCQDDDIVDEIHKNCYANIKAALAKHPENSMAQMHYLLVCRAIERIADLCTNIAEDIIYMKSSIIVRHNLKYAIDTLNSRKNQN